MYIWTTAVFKLALAIFFLRIIQSKWQRQVIYVTISLYCLYSFAFLFLNIFRCGPPAKYFEHEISGSGCLPYVTVVGPMNYIHATLNALTDWIFAIMPIFVVMGTQMKYSARLTVICILCLGVLGSICSVIRLAYVKSLGTGDVLYSAPGLAMLSVAELGIGISASCMATFRPLMKRYTGQTVQSTRRGTSGVHASAPESHTHELINDHNTHRNASLVKHAPSVVHVSKTVHQITVAADEV